MKTVKSFLANPSTRVFNSLLLIAAFVFCSINVIGQNLSGTYHIKVKATNTFLHEDGLGDKLISTRYQANDDYTVFILEKQSDNSYRIRVKADNRYLHYDGWGDKLISTRAQETDVFTHFYFERQHDSSYRIRSMADNKYLHCDGWGDKLISTRYQETDDFTRFYLVNVGGFQTMNKAEVEKPKIPEYAENNGELEEARKKAEKEAKEKAETDAAAADWNRAVQSYRDQQERKAKEAEEAEEARKKEEEERNRLAIEATRKANENLESFREGQLRWHEQIRQVEEEEKRKADAASYATDGIFTSPQVGGFMVKKLQNKISIEAGNLFGRQEFILTQTADNPNKYIDSSTGLVIIFTSKNTLMYEGFTLHREDQTTEPVENKADTADGYASDGIFMDSRGDGGFYIEKRQNKIVIKSFFGETIFTQTADNPNKYIESHTGLAIVFINRNTLSYGGVTFHRKDV